MKSGEKIYLMGVAGTAMASLAGLLKDLGFEVTGSDAQIYPPMSTALEDLKIKVLTPYSPENLKKSNPDWVIIGNVISKNHPEAQYVLDNKFKYLSLPEALQKWVFPKAKTLVVTGTHGKTTTTSILAHCLQELESEGQKPGFLIGGIAQNFGKSYQNLESGAQYFAIEGDEYDTAFWEKTPKFLHYNPHSVILTSIEFDHADIYKDLEEIKLRFIQLLKMLPKDGFIIACEEDPNVVEVVNRCQKNIKATIIYYSQNPKNYNVCASGLSGQHNTLNSLAVYSLLKPLGFEEYKILETFKTFKGIKRRMEVVGETTGQNQNKIIIIDDFAHHPTAVKTTLEGAKNKYQKIDPNFKIWALFEPRSATSSTNYFQDDYAKSFGAADKILIAPIGREKIKSAPGALSTPKLAQDLRNQNLDAQACESIEQMVEITKKEINAPTVLLCMSNGGFGGIHKKLLKNFN